MASRAGIDREAVVRAGAQIADARGWDALTLAEVAARLKVQPPSLYNHIGGLDALRREIRLLALSELGAELQRATVGKSREQAVRELAAAYRAFVKRHPGIYAATAVPAPGKDAELRRASDRIVETCVAVLGGYGFDRRRATHAIRSLRAAVHGFTALEAAGGFGLPLDVDESFEFLVALILRGLDTSTSRAARTRPRRGRIATA